MLIPSPFPTLKPRLCCPCSGSLAIGEVRFFTFFPNRIEKVNPSMQTRAFGARWCRGFRWTPKGKVWLLDCTTNWFSALGKTQIIIIYRNFQLEFYNTISTIQRIYKKKKESRIKAPRRLLMPFLDFKYFSCF